MPVKFWRTTFTVQACHSYKSVLLSTVEPKLKSVERRLLWAPDAASPEAALLVLAEALLGERLPAQCCFFLVLLTLGYAQLQVTSERRSIKATSTYREVVSHLRSVFDEGNSEEHRHIEKVSAMFSFLFAKKIIFLILADRGFEDVKDI